jgi:hypothetical protein
MEVAPYPQSTEILYEEYIENGTMLLYKDESGFRQAFYSEKEGYWSHTGNAELNPKDGFTWNMNNNPNIPLAMFSGVITEDKIQQVIVKQKTVEQEAKIIVTKEGYRIWYANFDILEEPSHGEPDPLKIEAFDIHGNVLWKDGVYENGLFSGRTN